MESRLVVEVSVLLLVELGVLQCCVETVCVWSRLVMELSVLVLVEFSVVWKQCVWSPGYS